MRAVDWIHNEETEQVICSGPRGNFFSSVTSLFSICAT